VWSLLEFVPGEHGVHDVEFSNENVPAEHACGGSDGSGHWNPGMQIAQFTDSDVEYVPIGQGNGSVLGVAQKKPDSRTNMRESW